MDYLKQDKVNLVRNFLSDEEKVRDFFVTVEQLEDLYNSVSAATWIKYQHLNMAISIPFAHGIYKAKMQRLLR